jgi:protein TonB
MEPRFEAFASYGRPEESPRHWVAALFGSSAVYLALALGVMAFSAMTKKIVVEKRVDLTFVEKIVKEEPPPPPPPPAPEPRREPVVADAPKAAPAAAPVVRPHQKVRKLDKPPPAKELVAPKEMPKEAPKEADPSLDQGVAVYGEPGRGDPAGLEGGISKGVVGGQVGIIDLPPDASPPKPLKSNVQPRYPESERRKRRIGSQVVVILRIVIHADGTVGDVQVVQGEEPFVTAAREAVQRWRYEPARYKGQPISVRRATKVTFQLNA